MSYRAALRSMRPLYRPTPIHIRPFTKTTHLAARKDTMGKDDLKPEGNEYSKSASDGEAADDTAFDPKQTRPEEQLESAEADSGKGNPLDASPANAEISKPRKGTEGGPESSSAQSGQGPSDRQRSSGGSGTGSDYKGGEGKRYDGK
ncbi:hypothetical protein CAC42_536 [Sphaceloma murrayae]|uniref:Uncharacterized protein n=1 Tax=Sphaceloma murrayae TaxID=2082308 RepID=A0A2K1R3T1_9PEZI|nr:hypothetical protein CAC42_536 [Sphaceloma murrayae]